MRQFAEASERIRGTSKKLEKVRIVADYLKSSPLEEATVAAVFLSGTPFPAWEETTLQVGGRLLWQVIEELSGRSSQELTAAYRKHGDLGAAAAEVLEASDMGPGRAKLGSLEAPADPGRTDRASVREVQTAFRQIAAARGPSAKALLVRELLSQMSPLEAKYTVKIITGDLRIGLQESLV